MVVLNIDDDDDDREMFCEALTAIDSGIACVQIESGIKALKYIANAEILPDYIFVDINMPKMNGYEFVEALQRSPGFMTIPVIMLSTVFNPSNKEGSTKMGIRHLHKSSHFSDLVRSIKDIIGVKLKEEEPKK